MAKVKRGKVVRYNKWGYIFLIPFVVVYVLFQLIPLFRTFYYSFFENYRSGLTQIGPNFIGFGNYAKLLSNPDLWMYTKNTLIMWILGFVPQIIISLLLGAWFSDPSLRLKGQRFFKTVIYLPNLIMASAFAMLFFTLFSDGGPINEMLMQIGILKEPYQFLTNVWSTRGLVALMNFLMWFGNTTILLMAGMMGIDTSLFEAAEVVTNGKGDPMRSSMTLIMYLNNHLYSKNYGMSGALSVMLFIITGILSLIVFKFSNGKQDK